MSLVDEDRGLTSLLAAHTSDVLRYARLPYFADLFPSRRKVAEFISNYLTLTGNIPSLKVIHRRHPKVLDGKPQRPEPLVAVMTDLREALVDSVVSQYADDMATAHSKQELDKYIELSEQMAARVAMIRAPLESGALDTADYTQQLLADLDKDAASLTTLIPTGFPPLDREWGGGLRGGRLYVMSALVNLGKTYISAGIAENVRAAGYRTLYASLEMSRNDIAERSLCIRYQLNVNHYIKLEQPDSDKRKRVEWYKDLLQQRLALEQSDKCKGRSYIMGNETGVMQPKTLRSMAKEHGVHAIFIDAAQDIRDNSNSRDKVSALYAAIAELNALAVELNVPIFMTVQLQAEVEKKNIKSGNLANIAWGQVFAQKAHSVITVLGDRSTGRRDVTIDKARDGQVGMPFTIELIFPNIQIVATDVQPVGINLSEEDVFSSIDDLNSELAALIDSDAEEDAAAPPTPPSSYVLTQDDEEESVSEYEKRKEERAKKRLKGRLQKKRGR